MLRKNNSRGRSALAACSNSNNYYHQPLAFQFCFNESISVYSNISLPISATNFITTTLVALFLH